MKIINDEKLAGIFSRFAASDEAIWRPIKRCRQSEEADGGLSSTEAGGGGEGRGKGVEGALLVLMLMPRGS